MCLWWLTGIRATTGLKLINIMKTMEKTINIAIFASGNGSNAQNIAEYFTGDNRVNISRIYTNKPDAYVLERARKLGIPAMVFNKKQLNETGEVLQQLKDDATDFVVLAGFLLKVPDAVIDAFPQRIVNIHPALLPDYGGKGMYGMRVHEAVKAAGDDKSGITIHYVNSAYDEGNIIFQAWVPVESSDTPDDIAEKVHKLEYEHFPKVIDELISEL